MQTEIPCWKLSDFFFQNYPSKGNVKKNAYFDLFTEV